MSVEPSFNAGQFQLDRIRTTSIPWQPAKCLPDTPALLFGSPDFIKTSNPFPEPCSTPRTDHFVGIVVTYIGSFLYADETRRKQLDEEGKLVEITEESLFDGVNLGKTCDAVIVYDRKKAGHNIDKVGDRSQLSVMKESRASLERERHSSRRVMPSFCMRTEKSRIIMVSVVHCMVPG